MLIRPARRRGTVENVSYIMGRTVDHRALDLKIPGRRAVDPGGQTPPNIRQVNPPELSVRRAVEADLSRLAQLAARLVRQHHAFDARRFFLQEPVERGYEWWFARELPRDGAVILVAARGAEIVGYTYSTIEERDWNLLLDAHAGLHDIYVDDEQRGLGVGKALLDATLAELTRLGAPRVVLMSATQNLPAQRLFAKLGFRPTMVEMTRELVGDG